MPTERYDAIINVDYTGTAGAQRYIADVRRMLEASKQLALGLGGGGALAIGTGAGANADVAGAQRAFVAGLRDRAAADREYAAMTRRLAKEEAVLRRPGAQGSFSDAGVLGVKFDQNIRQLESGSARLARQVDKLTADLARAEASLKPITDRQRNAYAASNNLAHIEGIAGQYRSELAGSSMDGATIVRASYTVAQELEELVYELRKGPNASSANKTLLYGGQFNKPLLEALSPETREALLGSREGARTYGATALRGPTVKGLINQAEARSRAESEGVGGLDSQLRSAKIELADKLREENRVIALETQVVQGVVVAERTLTREVEQATSRLRRMYHSSPEGNFQSIMARGLDPTAKITREKFVYLSDKPGAFTGGDTYAVDVDPRKLTQAPDPSTGGYHRQYGFYRHEGVVPPSAIDEVVRKFVDYTKNPVGDESYRSIYQRQAGALVHVPGAAGEQYPEYDKARRAIEARAAAETSSSRERVAAETKATQSATKLAEAEERAAAAAQRLAAQHSAGGASGGGIGGPPPTGQPPYGDDDDRIHRDWVDAEEERIRAIQADTFSTEQRRQANVHKARTNLEDVIAKGDIPFGEKGAFADETARSKAYATARGQLHAAEELLTKAVQDREKAERKAAQAANANAAAGGAGGGAGGSGGAGSGGFFGDFRKGFHGRQDRSYAEQLGQTFKFSVFYGAAYKILFALTQTLQATLQEGIAFQEAMTNLSIATGRPKEKLDDLAAELGRSAVVTGAAPSQGIEVGARSLGLYGVADNRGEQDRVARISAEVVSRLAVGSKKQPVELQADIASIAQALGVGAEGQYRIADLDAFFTKKFGIQQGSTLQAVGESATVGKAAGFSDEQLFAIAADLISRTGQTSSSVAGFMAQIFSRGGEGSLTTVAQRYGIDPTQKLADVVTKLADVYSTASSEQRTQIAAAFGRGKVQNAAIALLNDYGEVQSQVGKAGEPGGAAGAADRAFRQHMDNVGGQIQLLSGAFKDFAQLLGQAGVLDALGLFAIVLREGLEAINGVLRIFNSMDVTIRRVIGGLVLFAIATRTAAGAAALQRLTGGSSLALAGAASAGGLARAGALGALGLLANPVTIAIGGLLAVGAWKNQADAFNDAASNATEALLRAGGLGLTSGAGEYEAQAAAQRALAKQTTVGGLANFMSGGKSGDAAKRLRDNLKAAADINDEIAKYKQGQLLTGEVNPFTDFTKTGLDSTFQNLSASGADSARQLDLLRRAIAGLGSDSQKAREEATKLDVGAFSKEVSNPIQRAIAAVASDKATFGFVKEGRAAGFSNAGAQSKDFQRSMAEILGQDDIVKALQDQLRSRGIATGAQLTPDVQHGIAQAVAPDLAQTILAPFDVPSGNVQEIQNLINEAIEKALTDAVNQQYGGFLGTQKLDVNETKDTILGNLNLSQQKLADLPQSDFSARIREARQALNTNLKLLTDGSIDENSSGTVLKAIQDGRSQLVREQIARLDALQKIATQDAKSQGEADRLARPFINRKINVAVKNRDQDALAEILASTGTWAVSVARDAVSAALKTARAAKKLADDMAAEAKRIAGLTGAIFGGGTAAPGAPPGIAAPTGPGITPPKTAAQVQADKDLKTLLSIHAGAYPSDGASGGGSQTTAAQLAAAKAQAFAQRDGGQIAAAKAAIISARADMAAAEKGTVEYYNALGALFSAQQQLADAILGHQRNLGLLRIDATNPLQMARLEARLAARKLAQDRASGKGVDVIAQDKVDLRAAQANAEATAFSQRLQSVQTAEELGRISHGKYINYLNNEKRRLESIKNRTFQQQDQLDQIDRLLKDASNQMNAQFNFGDIKLPTPYAVRRYIEAQTGATAARQVDANARSTPSVTNTFYVNGADTGKVTQIIRDVVGKGSRVSTTTTRRK